MSQSSLYDDDILLWSEQQAAAIRKLARGRRDLPNELDIENVAEEIESVGRSELAAVESHLELILLHLIKLVVEPEAAALLHWRGEIVGFHARAKRRYTPSMRQRIDMADLWRSAREQALLAYEGAPHALAARLPQAPVIDLDDLIGPRIEPAALAARLRLALAPA